MKNYVLFSMVSLFLLIGPQSFGTEKSIEHEWTATGKNLAALKGMPIKVYLPTVVPTDYVLFDYSLEDELKNTDAGHPNYVVIYLKDKSHWFRIESADTIGGADWDNAKITESKSGEFGRFSIQWTQEVALGEVIKTSKVITSWLQRPDAKKNKSQSKSFRFYHLFGRGISADEAVTIVKSLRPQN